MFCTNCGKEIIDTAKFCNFCGFPQKVPVRQPEPPKPVSEAVPTPVPTPVSEPILTQPVSSFVYEPEDREPVEAPVESVVESAAESPSDGSPVIPNSAVPTPNIIPSSGTSFGQPAYPIENIASPLPVNTGVSPSPVVPVSTEAKPVKAERKYTLGHIMMCLAAVAVMAITAGVFAGLYFSV